MLTVEGLHVWFAQKGAPSHVVNNVKFTLHPGELLAIVGASGSGKSVFAHSLMQCLPGNGRWEGRICYDGCLVDEAVARAHFTLIPQSVSYLDPLMKVDRQLPLQGDGLARKAKGLYPFQCSGGMLRNALCQVAREKPGGVVIADEPTSGLDTQSALAVLSQLKALTQQGRSVILITHDMDLAVEVADRIGVFYQGTILETLASADFAAGRMTHPYSKALYAAMPQHGFTPCVMETAVSWC